MSKPHDHSSLSEYRKKHDELKKLVRDIQLGVCSLTPREIAQALNADVEMAKSARADECTDLMAALMVFACEAKLAPSDTTQADISDVAYLIIREAAWRVAAASSYEEAEMVAQGALEAAQSDFGSIAVDQRDLNKDIEIMSLLLSRHLRSLFGVAAGREMYESYTKLVSSMLQVSCRAAASFALRTLPPHEVVATLESVLDAVRHDPAKVAVMSRDEQDAARPRRVRRYV